MWKNKAKEVIMQGKGMLKSMSPYQYELYLE